MDFGESPWAIPRLYYHRYIGCWETLSVVVDKYGLLAERFPVKVHGTAPFSLIDRRTHEVLHTDQNSLKVSDCKDLDPVGAVDEWEE